MSAPLAPVLFSAPHEAEIAPPGPHAGSLDIVDLAFRFASQKTALFNISRLTLRSGMCLGIRGASGAGKTTLLHCLAGIAPATSGQIRWGGTDIATLSASDLTRWRQQSLGLVFQDFHLVEGLSARDNVLLPASFTAWRADAALKQRAASLLARVGISAPQRRAELLSRGERQRVAVARALLFSPPVLLADEPTASLDPANREIVGELLCGLAREHGATLLVVSHEESLLARMDRVLELREGSLATPSPAPTA